MDPLRKTKPGQFGGRGNTSRTALQIAKSASLDKIVASNDTSLACKLSANPCPLEFRGRYCKSPAKPLEVLHC